MQFCSECYFVLFLVRNGENAVGQVKVKPVGKLIILLLVGGAAFGAYRMFGSKLIPTAPDKPPVTPNVGELPENKTLGNTPNTNIKVTMPGTEPGCPDKPEVRYLCWAWNAQMGAMFANGGPQATSGSLMCQKGVNLKFIRQDDVSKMQEALIAFATALSQGDSNPSAGAHYVAIMGDGAATFLQTLNEKLKRLGPEYIGRVVGTIGFSLGEDKFMGLPQWKVDPNSARGGVVSGYLRDGDWNIAQKWLSDNGLPNNPDEKTYDPNALNWVSANDYLDACEKYITGYTEERPVVRNGKKTGETKRITIGGVVTWTPGDVNIAQKKGGLVSIASTKEYSSQMPCTIIGINKWMKANRSTVENMLEAFWEGGDAVKSSSEAMQRAGEISAQIYKEQDAAYWIKYARGVTEKDAQGISVELGGSKVNNLTDALYTFGLVKGSQNLFAATYTLFGDIVKQQYPELVPTYPPVSEILDTSYIEAVAKRAAPAATAVAKVQNPFVGGNQGGGKGKPKPVVLSRRNWNIQFQTGKDTFTPSSVKTLSVLRRDLLVAGNTYVDIHGHTDSIGNPITNKTLSEKRAFAVKKWLEKQAPLNFPQGRIKVYAHGQDQPLEPNSSEAGRSKNRRVEIVLSTSGS
jgi:OmpA-OmpF porin, OOP family